MTNQKNTTFLITVLCRRSSQLIDDNVECDIEDNYVYDNVECDIEDNDHDILKDLTFKIFANTIVYDFDKKHCTV